MAKGKRRGGDGHSAGERAPKEPEQIPALFATIHFKSKQRPNGHTDDDMRRLNEMANAPRKPMRD